MQNKQDKSIFDCFPILNLNLINVEAGVGQTPRFTPEGLEYRVETTDQQLPIRVQRDICVPQKTIARQI